MAIVFGPGYNATRTDLWTDTEIYILRDMTESGFSVDDIMFVLKRSRRAILSKRHKMGFISRRRYTSEEINIIRRYAGIESASFIASLLGRSFYSVCRAARNNGISLTRYGDNCSFSVYSDEDVLLIRQLHDEGLSVKEISGKFDVPSYMIYQYVCPSCCLNRKYASYAFTKSL